MNFKDVENIVQGARRLCATLREPRRRVSQEETGRATYDATDDATRTAIFDATHIATHIAIRAAAFRTSRDALEDEF